MKRREEDQLIHLAFGELAADEAARVEANLKPQAARALEDYRSLKSDLKLLNSVPAPQIGVERMRDAILRQGLKRDRSFGRWALIFGPCLVAALAVFVVTARPSTHQSNSSTSEVAANLPDWTAQTPQAPALYPDTEITDRSKAIHEDVVFPQPENAPKSVHAAVLTVRRRLHRPLSIAQVSSNMVALADSQMSQPAPTPVEADQGSTSGAGPQTASDDSGQSAQGDQKIIVVHNAQDGATGAQTATEVDPSANVVFGG